MLFASRSVIISNCYSAYFLTVFDARHRLHHPYSLKIRLASGRRYFFQRRTIARHKIYLPRYLISEESSFKSKRLPQRYIKFE